MCSDIFNRKKMFEFIFFIFISFTLIYTYYNNLRMFLFLVGSVDIIIGFTIAIIATHTYHISQNNFLTLLAIAFAFISLFDFSALFVSTYSTYDSFISEYLYLQVFGDYFKLFSLLLACKFYNKNLNFKFIAFVYFCLTMIFTLALFVFKILPDITVVLFGVISLQRFILINKFLLSVYVVYVIYKNRYNFLHSDSDNLIYTSISFSISLFSFIFYVNDTILRPISHIFILIHLYIVYRMIIKSVLVKPYNSLFNKLISRTEELECINKELKFKNVQLEKVKIELEKSKDHYENLVESLPDSILIRRDNKIIFSNLASLKLFKANSKYDIHNIDIIDFIPINYLDKFKIHSEKRGKSFEIKLKTLDGNKFDATVIEIDIILNERNAILTLIKDISETKKVYELKSKLQKKIDEDKIRTEFFSNISHELRTPINVIYSLSQLGDIHIKNKNIDSLEKHSTILKQNCFRLLRICNNLIDITKIDTGYFKPNMKYLNIIDVVENIVLSVSFYIESKNMNIVFDTDAEESYILCDGDLIERIILNLISNSLKYGNDGGHIWVNIYDESEHIKIIFKDNGPGIPQCECNNVFERFTQVDRSFNRKCEGSGIGLSLVKLLIELHDGSITLESDENLGCEFTIILPKNKSYLCDEVSVTHDDSSIENSRIIEKVNIEFSDIYL